MGQAVINVTPDIQQYSDKVSFTASIANNCLGSSSSGNVKAVFKIGNLLIGEAALVNGVATLADRPLTEESIQYTSNGTPAYLASTNGPLKPGLKTVTAFFVNTDNGDTLSQAVAGLTVTPEHADLNYTGGTYFSVNPSTLKGMGFYTA